MSARTVTDPVPAAGATHDACAVDVFTMDPSVWSRAPAHPDDDSVADTAVSVPAFVNDMDVAPAPGRTARSIPFHDTDVAEYTSTV